MKRDATGKFVSNWDSEPKQRVSITLTKTAWQLLGEAAQQHGISRSEVIEQVSRQLQIPPTPPVTPPGTQPVEFQPPPATCQSPLQLQQPIATLQRQNQELEALLETAPDAIARFDLCLRFRYVNRVVEQTLGLSRAALLGKTISEVMSAPIAGFWEEQLGQVLTTAQEREIEFEWQTSLGARFYQARLVPELDEGTPIAAVMISRDITATKQAEQQRTQQIAAQATEQKAATILESITDAFVAFDRDWRYTYINQAAAKILHKTPAELLGKHVWSQVFPETVGGIAYRELHRAMTEQVPVAWEEFGEPVQRWLEANAYPSTEGIAVYFRDVTERKQAEAERERLLQALETERAQFEAVLRQMPAGVMIADAASGKLVLANEQAKQIVGYRFEQSLELEDYESVTPFTALRADGRPYAADQYPLVRSLKTGEIVTNEEMEVHREDGRCIFITINSAPVLDKHQQIVTAVVVFQDITARKQTEMALHQQTEALENQQKWLETVLDLMPTPTVFIEPGTAKITFSNRIAQQLVDDFPKHHSPDRHSDTDYCTDANGDRLTPERMPAVLLANGNRLENYEINWHTPSGLRSTLCWGDTLPAMYGHRAICICMFQDITRLKQTEENLRQTEERLQLALSSACMVAWDMDLQTNCVVCSPNAREIWGMQQGTGEDFFATIHPDDRLRVAQAAQQAIAGETAYFQEYRVIGVDGVTRWLNSQGRVYLNSAGQGVRMLGVSVDVTDRKQAEAEREHLLQRERAAREAAESANRIKDEFLAVLSHELRSPLNPILGWAKLLRTRTLDASKTAHALATIERNAKLQSELIEDLLDVSRILQGKLSLNSAPVNLVTTTQAAIETVRLAAEAKAIEIQSSLDPIVGQVLGDANRLQQIVWNLLANAVKFTPAGGRVQVRLEQIIPEQIIPEQINSEQIIPEQINSEQIIPEQMNSGQISSEQTKLGRQKPESPQFHRCKAQGSYAQITVADTGTGIHPDFLPHVFDYFRQADSATTRKYGGLGLGLAIVRHLVELHGGTVQAKSLGEGLGATFVVRLPLLTAQPNTPVRQPLAPPLALNGMHILVVDDDTDTREFVVFVLEQAGANVLSAASAAEALAILAQSKPDILLSDIGMPAQDGYMLMREVKRLFPESGRKLPTGGYASPIGIALTAFAGEMNQQQAFAAGFQMHLAKPIEPDHLVAMMARFVSH